MTSNCIISYPRFRGSSLLSFDVSAPFVIANSLSKDFCNCFPQLNYYNCTLQLNTNFNIHNLSNVGIINSNSISLLLHVSKKLTLANYRPIHPFI